MDWFKALRSSGEKNKLGEFTVEDSEGVEWQVTAIESKKKPGTLTLLNEVVCMNRGYECSWELRADIQQAVRDLIASEVSDDAEEITADTDQVLSSVEMANRFDEMKSVATGAITPPRRITIDVSPSAAGELDRMAKSRGQKTAELFRSAMSLMRIAVNAAECGMEIHLVDPTGAKDSVKLEIH